MYCHALVTLGPAYTACRFIPWWHHTEYQGEAYGSTAQRSQFNQILITTKWGWLKSSTAVCVPVWMGGWPKGH